MYYVKQEEVIRLAQIEGGLSILGILLLMIFGRLVIGKAMKMEEKDSCGDGPLGVFIVGTLVLVTGVVLSIVSALAWDSPFRQAVRATVAPSLYALERLGEPDESQAAMADSTGTELLLLAQTLPPIREEVVLEGTAEGVQTLHWP